MPALLTRMSIGPTSASTRWTPSEQAAASPTSHWNTGMPVSPRKASAFSRLPAKLAATLWPESASPLATAAPIPRVPPVTSTTLVIVSSHAAALTGRLELQVSRATASAAAGSVALDAHGDAHAAADAKRRKAPLRVAPLHLEKQGREHARAGRPDRMADGDRPAIDVDDVGVPAEILVDRASLCREGLVRLHQLEVLLLPAGLLERPPRCGDRPRAHDRRIDARRRPGNDP